MFVEYAKASPEDILIQITVHNRGPERGDAARPADALVPQHLVLGRDGAERRCSTRCHGRAASSRRRIPQLGERYLYCEGDADAAVHRERDQHAAHLRTCPTARPYVKDGINDYIVHGQREAVNPEQTRHEGGGALPRSSVEPARVARRAAATDRRPSAATGARRPFGRLRRRCSQPAGRRRTSSTRRSFRRRSTPTQRNVMRQALAGMLWTKQFYNYDVDRWLEERGADPFKPTARRRRATTHWHHMHNADIISMPDKWEYPWYAAWDLAFHVLALTLVDPDFGKQQLELMLQRALPAPERPDPRLRVELRRRQSAGARLGDDLHLPAGEGAARRGRRRLARALVPEAAAQLHLVGQPQGPHRQATCSRAGSSGSTTSASSTAARRCRPAATWSRPTAPRGWRSSARTCSRSRSSWR